MEQLSLLSIIEPEEKSNQNDAFKNGFSKGDKVYYKTPDGNKLKAVYVKANNEAGTVSDIRVEKRYIITKTDGLIRR